MVSDWSKTQKKPTVTNQIRTLFLTTKFKKIVPANNTSTTQFVFGQERSLFPHPKTRNINQGKSKEINLSATYPVAKKYRNREGGWEKNYTR